MSDFDFSGIKEPIRGQCETLYDQLLFMQQRLDTSVRDLNGQKLIVRYNNGGGQSGIHKNPYFDAYESLMGTYIRALSTFENIISKGTTVDDNNSRLRELRVVAGKRVG